MRWRAAPAVKPRREPGEKPPMPEEFTPVAGKALERHRRRSLSPGAAVDVEKVGEVSYVVASPHSDDEAWQAMICDALGTRSTRTAQTFLNQLAELCSQNWHPSETEGERGEWCPDEAELNMILAMVAGIKPRNEMEAAQAAQMVAVHLMTMQLLARVLSAGCTVPQDVAIVGKLARTFSMQMDALGRAKGRKTTRQTIKVSHEKHIHQHQHVHLEGGAPQNESQCHAAKETGAVETEGCAALPCPDKGGGVVPFPSREGKARVSNARRKGGGSEG